MPRRYLALHALIYFLAAAMLGVALVGRALLPQMLLLAGAVTALAVAVLAWEQAELLRGVRAVADAARHITAGRHGREVQVPAKGDVRVMLQAFNDMSVTLAEQFASIDRDRLQLRAILGGMIEGVVAIDARQRVLFANDRGAQLLEFNLPTATGLRFWEVVRQRSLVSLVERAIEQGESQLEEFDWKGQPGKSLAVRVQPLREKPGGAILVIHDTSELRRLERLRHEFVANVSHELKTPLAVIRASAETLQDGAIDDLEHRGTFLEQIHDQVERLNNLILDLLSLARIETGAEATEFTRVVLRDVVQDCFERHHARADARGQQLEMFPAAEASSNQLRTDEEALAQILDNLVDNAIKYTPEGSRIRVRWQGIGDQIWIEVDDNGPGIPEEDLPRIFERFYRVDKARSRELGGTGLGLAIVKNLANLLKGSVKVTSEVGRGTTFTVALPRSPQ